MSDTPRTDGTLEILLVQLGTIDRHNCPEQLVVLARKLEVELNAANERVKRLVKVGDEMEKWMRNPRNLGGDPFMADQWQDAKEATR